mgnify:FL=1
MLEILQLSEADFLQWLVMKQEKREYRMGKQLNREKGRDLLYELLFLEQGLTAEDIEHYFVPFG